MTVIEYNVN